MRALLLVALFGASVGLAGCKDLCDEAQTLHDFLKTSQSSIDTAGVNLGTLPALCADVERELAPTYKRAENRVYAIVNSKFVDRWLDCAATAREFRCVDPTGNYNPYPGYPNPSYPRRHRYPPHFPGEPPIGPGSGGLQCGWVEVCVKEVKHEAPRPGYDNGLNLVSQLHDTRANLVSSCVAMTAGKLAQAEYFARQAGVENHHAMFSLWSWIGHTECKLNPNGAPPERAH